MVGNDDATNPAAAGDRGSAGETPSARCGPEPASDVTKLEAGLGGRWLVTTQGSQHVWDLDEMTYQRLPGHGRGQFDYDRAIVSITRVGAWPEVGAKSLVYYDDLVQPELYEQWRLSSKIRRIERLPDRAGPEGGDGPPPAADR